MSYQELLQRFTAKDSRSSEPSFRCLCCKDDGLIDRFTVRRYLLQSLSPWVQAEYEMEPAFLSATGVLCTRPGCRANELEVAGENGRRLVERFSEDDVVVVEPQHCQWIHEQELARFQGSAPAPAPAAVHHAIASGGIGGG